ncbi:MAG: HlyD family secretion protein [Amphiplicatus sp.]
MRFLSYSPSGAFIAALIALASCSDDGQAELSGYVEGDMLMMAAQDGGLIAALSVKEGDHVEAGAVLFRLDPERAEYALDEAEAAAAAARARAADKGALDQQVAEAEADLERARKAYRRSRDLAARDVAPAARLDNDRAAFEAAKARAAGARAARDIAGRDVAAAAAAAALARRRLADHEVKASVSGSIERVYRRAGEIVAAGEPVLALLPPENMKVRFYAPETALASLSLGREIGVACDGCAEGLTARVSFIATEPQFTPPVIYSLKERTKLVFLIEARPDQADGLKPGLPVTVALGRASGLAP